MDILLYQEQSLVQCFQMFYDKWQQLGNCTGIP